jgi:(Z)-2-((N-methylformamido)methylene)-5-hydroxybutyrolactone dehydrogenase
MAEMLGQLRYHPEWWRYFGGLADKVEGAVMPIDKPEMFAFTRHEPMGVVGALTAWNSAANPRISCSTTATSTPLLPG